MRFTLPLSLLSGLLVMLLPLGGACQPLEGDDDDMEEQTSSIPPAQHGSNAVALARSTLIQETAPPAAVIPSGAALTQSALRVQQGDEVLELPLLHTDVDAEISGFVADVAVHQLYANPFEQPIEAIYLFPLPDNAAVNDMQMRIGDRVVVSEIKRREEAKEIYEVARDAGKTAALLDQERPNVFQQSVANILPGEAIEITIHFVQQLDYEDGGYEWAFPMVVGPRFIPTQGTGQSGGTTPIEDADRLDAPVSKTRTGNDISVAVSIDAGLAIQDMTSPSHEIDVTRPSEATADVLLAANDSIPNKDFVLRYEVAGQAPETAFLTHRDGEEGYFTLLLQPQAEDQLTEQAVTPKEMVFVIDTSCSQSGEPLARAKEAVELAITEMNPQDRFWVLNFNSSVSTLSNTSLANTTTNRRRGIDYIRSFRGGGGTNMLEGIQAALDLPSNPDLLRTVVFMTDGYIGNETEILATIEERLGNSRVFSFGVGSSTNRYLLNRMAKVGRGHAQYILQGEDPSEQVENFYSRIRNPVLTDVQLDWEGVELLDVHPDPVPDLFSAQPLVLVGRYTTPGQGTLRVTGKIRGQKYERVIPLHLPKRETGHRSLGSLWARTVIEDLENRRYRNADDDIGEQIIELALEHRLMTRETSFVAVEERVVTDGQGAPTRVRVPLEIPQGVSHSAIFGEDQVEPQAHGMYAPRGAIRGRGHGGGGSARHSGLGGLGARGTGMGGAGYGRGALAKREEGRVGVATNTASEGKIGDSRPRTFTNSDESDESLDHEVEVPEPEAPSRLVRAVLVVRGGADDDVQRILKRRVRGIEQAWRDWVNSHPEAQGGTWLVEITIDESGKIVGVHLKADKLGVPALAAKFKTQALGWQFPSPAGANQTAFEVTMDFSLVP